MDNASLRVDRRDRATITRGHFISGLGGLLLLGAVGCGGGGASGSGSSEPSSESRTIEHKFGSTEVTGKPARVTSVGFNDQDTLLALGVIPVGVREWYGEYPFATWPWAQDELGDAKPEMVGGFNSINFEAVASTSPDLIVGVSSGMTQDDYDTLSQIAPTLPQTDEYVDYGVPWQDQVRLTGRALGITDQAEELVTGLENRFAEIKEEYSGFGGATALVAARYDNYSVYGPDDIRGRLLTDLGFEIPQDVADLVGEDFAADVSEERLELLDVDMLIMFANNEEEVEELRNDPLFSGLSAAEEGRVLFYSVESLVAGALSFSSPLSLPYVLDAIVPQMEIAVDGDPATEPDLTDITVESTR